MNLDPDRRVASLVHYCQRVASNHIDFISSLGDLSYPLVKPILERCSAEQLLRLEHNAPHHSLSLILFPEIWKELCFRDHPISVQRYLDEEPESWREQYTVLVEEEHQKFEAAGNRLRIQRLQAEERKKEREVRLTDRVPPAKRARPWGPSQPKSLFQKTRSEASKIQRTMYNARMVPPMPKGKDYRVTKTPNVDFPFSPEQISALNRVTVNTVVHRRPGISSESQSPASSSSSSSSSSQPVNPKPSPSRPQISPPLVPKPIPKTDEATPVSPSKQEDASPKPPLRVNKAPGSIFMPKHRAYSQRTG
ncbi:hypothetical protein D9758_000744 [Tetrapyrgos nigripes]|uniref:Elongin-A n=1 Tax=Tetrapyrgos nigripes TaxID=182062 RepID=A0A8H5GYP4_9AGAR|nr:hypothetical protein D9758_000744 [Tetrapyrgos nigripes]